MATRGFEFAYMLDGTQAVPVVRDFILSTAVAYKQGDLVTSESDGDVTLMTTGIDGTFVTGVMAESVAAGDITAGTTNGKVSIVTRNQVWKCSTDASTAATAIVGYIKKWDTVDANTIDASDVTGGNMIPVEVNTAKLDDDGNLIGYVVFADTAFGNT